MLFIPFSDCNSITDIFLKHLQNLNTILDIHISTSVIIMAKDNDKVEMLYLLFNDGSDVT